MSIDIKVNFSCGHPRTPENSIRTGRRDRNYRTCRFCMRVYHIARQVELDQDRINRGEPLRRWGPVSRYA